MNLNEFLLKNKEEGFYIYGAGVVGFYCGKKILRDGFHIKSFIVTAGAQSSDEIFGIPVMNLDEAGNIFSDPIIVATLPNLQKELVKNLEAIGCKRIYQITLSEYQSIRAEAPSMDGELQKIIQAEGRERVREAISWFDSEYINCYIGRENDSARYRSDFEDLISDSNAFDSAVRQLASGMDSKSQVEVFRIIGRLNCLVENKPVIYSQEENEQVLHLRRDFYNQIYHLTDDTYSYSHYILPTDHFEASVFYYKQGLDALNELIIEEINEEHRDIIDAGGYVGDSAIILREKFNGNIYSFEPFRKNFQKMQRTLKDNCLENVYSEELALSDSIGTENLYLEEGTPKSANSVLINNFTTFAESSYVSVNSTTLDAFVKSNHLHVGLIKTDVEGEEQRLLLGAVETIREQKPMLLISIYHSIRDFFFIKPWLEQLDLGYRFKIIRPVLDNSFLQETLLLAEPEKVQ